MHWEGKWQETQYGCMLHVYLLSLPVNEDGNKMIAMLKRFQSKPLLPEKPLKAHLSSVSDPVQWCGASISLIQWCEVPVSTLTFSLSGPWISSCSKLHKYSLSLRSSLLKLETIYGLLYHVDHCGLLYHVNHHLSIYLMVLFLSLKHLSDLFMYVIILITESAC